METADYWRDLTSTIVRTLDVSKVRLKLPERGYFSGILRNFVH
jgi:hypothetical protein